MLRSLLCAAAVFSLVFSICLLPQIASARRCPVKEPETLLSLYQNSDAIYVAAFDKITDGETVESNADYSVQDFKKHFTISSTLKGESRKFFALDDRKYIYRMTAPEHDAQAEEEAETEEEIASEPEYSEEEESAELKPGDTLLLFVKNGSDEEGPTLADYRDGIKKMPMEKIGVYEARIRELNSIFGAKKVSETAVLEWLIRLAEDPVTRWEGTFELLRSVQRKEWEEQAAERLKESVANGEKVEGVVEETAEAEGENAEEISTHKNFDTSVFAKMLDLNRKQTLANILLNEHGSSSKRSEPVAGDQELIELVKRWGDPRLMSFLLDKLRAGSDDASSNSETMSMVAELIGDDTASEIAQKYGENAYENDNDFVGTEESEEVEVEETPVAENGEVVPVDPEPAAEPEQSGDPSAKPETPDSDREVKKQTYRELRTELMQKFLAQCEKVIADREKEKESKSRP